MHDAPTTHHTQHTHRTRPTTPHDHPSTVCTTLSHTRTLLAIYLGPRLGAVRVRVAWLSQSHSPLMRAIVQRMGIVANVPAGAVDERNVESINVLHYGVGAECRPPTVPPTVPPPVPPTVPSVESINVLHYGVGAECRRGPCCDCAVTVL